MKVIFVALLLAAATLNGKPPADLEIVRKAFAAAIAKHDRAAMADMTIFPLAVENYGGPPTLEKSAFLRDKDYFSGFFYDGDQQVVDCIGKSVLQFQPDKKQFGTGWWYAD